MPTDHSRRAFLGLTSTIAAGSVAGCLGAGSDGDSDGEDNANESTDGDTDADNSAENGNDDRYAKVVISGTGDWSGHIQAGGSGTSVQGFGKESYAISGDRGPISVSAQKDTDRRSELTVQIFVEETLVAEQSTTAEYGVASTSYSL